MSGTPTLDIVTKRLMGAETCVVKSLPESQRTVKDAHLALGKECLVVGRNEDGYVHIESPIGVRFWCHESQTRPHDS